MPCLIEMVDTAFSELHFDLQDLVAGGRLVEALGEQDNLGLIQQLRG